jgi:hypothetical protein
MPGPGQYEQTNKDNGPTFTFKGKPDNRERSKTPGPGNYNPDHFVTRDKVPNTLISKSSKNGLVSREEMEKPGPGNYEQKSGFGDG